MVQVLEQTADPETTPAIEATLNYVQNTGEKLFTYTGGPGSLDVRTGGTLDPRPMTIHNGRRDAKGFTLDRNGFRFVPHPTKMTDFFDEAEIKRVYYPEMEALIKAESGAKRVVVFDHTLRTADDASAREDQDPRSRAPRAQRLHRMVRAAARARHAAGRGRRICCAGRFAIIQVWRPIRHPVETHPLGIADARSVDAKDFIISERIYPNRVGQTYAVGYNPQHQWYWFPRMRRDEALVFKVFDSATDGRARWTAHTAFDDPTTPPNARPRESIEIRTLAFF